MAHRDTWGVVPIFLNAGKSRTIGNISHAGQERLEMEQEPDERGRYLGGEVRGICARSGRDAMGGSVGGGLGLQYWSRFQVRERLKYVGNDRPMSAAPAPMVA